MTAKKAARGRPTKYRAEYVEQAHRLALLGVTDAQVAAFFGVSERSVNEWKRSHPAFKEALDKGKMEADARVAESLFRVATGYSHPDLHIAVSQGEVIQTEIIKHYPPDVAAMRWWLKNRQSEKWRDKIEMESTVELVTMDAKSLDAIYVQKMQEAHRRQEEVLAERRELGLLDPE